MSLQNRTNQILEQTRDHRAELSRALKSLEIAYSIQNRMQHDLMIAKKMAEEAGSIKQQFAANISHELRTPLSLILGFSEIMYQSSEVYGDMEWSPALRRDIYQIYSNSLHLQKMIDDVLILSKYDIAEFTLKPERTDLAPFLLATADVARDLFRGTTNTFKTDLQAHLPVIDMDQTRIRQVIFNLINNANRFTDRGEITLKARVEAEKVIISVSDTGLGIPTEKLSQIFDSFYQADYSLSREYHGAGLGLAICKRFVTTHNGDIWVESALNQGSTFSFSLPMTVQKSYSINRHKNQLEDPNLMLAKPRILVTDPDPLITTMLQRNLPEYELICMEKNQSIEELVKVYFPQAIVHNTQIENINQYVYKTNDPILIIKCSLPSQTWQSAFPQVIDRLSKPISSDVFMKSIAKAGPLKSILIVDDDWGFIQLIQRMFEAAKSPLNIQTAHNGKMAIAAMRNEIPDIVLLDMIMPEMGGVEVLRAMTSDQRLCHVPVIILTGDDIREISQGDPESDVVIQRAGGLTPMEVLTCIKAAVSISKPVAKIEQENLL